MIDTAATLPRKTFARKIISMMGYSRADAIIEIVSIDKCSADEAARRYDLACAQSARRSVGQWRRHAKAKDAVSSARDLVLIIAKRNGIFALPEDLKDVSGRAGWGVYIGYDSTGRAYREFVLPMARDGLLVEKRDEDDKLIGYTITNAGSAFFQENFT